MTQAETDAVLNGLDSKCFKSLKERWGETAGFLLLRIGYSDFSYPSAPSMEGERGRALGGSPSEHWGAPPAAGAVWV